MELCGKTDTQRDYSHLTFVYVRVIGIFFAEGIARKFLAPSKEVLSFHDDDDDNVIAVLTIVTRVSRRPPPRMSAGTVGLGERSAIAAATTLRRRAPREC